MPRHRATGRRRARPRFPGSLAGVQSGDPVRPGEFEVRSKGDIDVSAKTAAGREYLGMRVTHERRQATQVGALPPKSPNAPHQKILTALLEVSLAPDRGQLA